MIPISDLIGKGKNQLRMDQVEIPKVAEYAAEDADATWRIETILSANVRAGRLGNAVRRSRTPAHSRAGRHGSGRDHGRRWLARQALNRVRGSSRRDRNRDLPPRRAVRSTSRHRRSCGKSSSTSSSSPSPRRRPAAKRAPPRTCWRNSPRSHPLPKLLIQHRQLSKLKGTYLDALPTLVHPDGRIHTSFNQVVAATGRLSSSDPNLQNIPTRTEDGRQIRQAFVPGAAGLEAFDGRLFADRAARARPLLARSRAAGGVSRRP